MAEFIVAWLVLLLVIVGVLIHRATRRLQAAMRRLRQRWERADG